MYTAKHAMLYKHLVPDGKPYVFYIDIRAGGKDYEEFIRQVQEEYGILYVRGKVSKLFEEDGRIVVWGVDTLSGRRVEAKVDMVVLSMGVVPSGTKEIAGILKTPLDAGGFLKEVHPKLRPVESAVNGVYICGMAQGPRDISETVAQASGAASKAMVLLSSDRLYHEPTVMEVDEDLCSCCGICVSACPYNAVKVFDRRIEVNEILCEGCGTCAAACPTGAAQVRNMTDGHVYGMIAAVLEAGG